MLTAQHGALDTLRKRKEECIVKWTQTRRAVLNAIIGKTQTALDAMGGDCAELLSRHSIKGKVAELLELDAEYERENRK